MLEQDNRPIDFVGRSLKAHEAKYDIMELEALAVVYFFFFFLHQKIPYFNSHSSPETGHYVTFSFTKNIDTFNYT